jgi:AhpD family alkylhydroperoxidase
VRELIAAYTSYVNQCEFCNKAHVAVATELLGSEDLVWSALRNFEASFLKEEERVCSDLPAK